ncbi:hypothetical protein Taro_035394 [Colocasia esculenta]|uniref:Uncharacterized protein n=1 Tax=Colocasia esculenta TaxID=4460 RepID=A0A843W5L6_COLES|nr:hypothetical protein [Colocasia esculenta]
MPFFGTFLRTCCVHGSLVSCSDGGEVLPGDASWRKRDDDAPLRATWMWQDISPVPVCLQLRFAELGCCRGVDPSSEVFQRIQIKYVEDDEGIRKYFAAFHLHEIFPVAIIIDDFGNFFDDRNCQDRYGSQRGRDIAMARTLALCWDAISQANEGLSEPCKLLLCDMHQGDSPRQLFIYKRWIPCIFTIKGQHCFYRRRTNRFTLKIMLGIPASASQFATYPRINRISCSLIAEGDGPSSFTFALKKNGTSAKSSGRERTAKYSVALQYLVLEDIIDD